jgi:sensor histidine kinase YesM
VKAVANGAAALEALEQHSDYDLVILDIMMPRISGLEVLESIRRRFEPVDLPVLLLTAKARPEDLLAGFEAGANDYLSKPFDALELKARVRTLAQLKRSISLRLQAELSFLQAQIKPHFLYNSLTVIGALSTKEPQRAEQLLYDLSDYLRGSFHFNHYNGVTFLSDELATVYAYVSLEQARFRDTLRVEFDIDESIELPIPMLAVQPLVENAIRHGISKKNGGGTVRLSVKRGSGQTLITVADDGVGIADSKRPELLAGKADGQGVGLHNIQRRMIAHYGHGLDIASKAGVGTTVTLRIPD